MNDIEEVEEVWKDIPGYEGYYQVSDLGRVRSLDRTIRTIDKRTVSYSGMVMSIKTNRKSGYNYIILSKHRNKKTFSMHVLVAISFLGHTQNGHNVVVDHINNIKTDNRVVNLQLITQRQNVSKGIRNCASRYVGVSYRKRGNKWIAAIRIEGKGVRLGLFTSEIDASNAYQAALKAHIENGGS